MIGPLQYERASKEDDKGVALSQVPAETVLYVLSFCSHHELQVVLQGGTEGQRQKAFGFWAEGCVKAGQNNINTTAGAGAQDLQQRICAAQNCRYFSRSAERWKIFMGPLYTLPGSIQD